MATKIRSVALALITATSAAALLSTAAPATADNRPDTAGTASTVSPAVPFSAAGRPVTEPRLTGSAQLLRLDGQDVRFSFDVRGFATDAKGTFSFTHRHGEQYAWAKLEADCLLTGGPTAVVTGFITDTNVPELKGKRKGVSVYDHGRHDRLGYSWGISHDVDVPECMSMPPFETVRNGDFTVHHWFPPLPAAR